MDFTNVHDADTRAQMADLGRMRTEHEHYLNGLLFAAIDAGRTFDAGAMQEAVSGLRVSLLPLLDAKYGPLPAQARSREVTPITAWSKPGCLACGAFVDGVGPFCSECDDILDENPLELERMEDWR